MLNGFRNIKKYVAIVAIFEIFNFSNLKRNLSYCDKIQCLFTSYLCESRHRWHGLKGKIVIFNQQLRYIDIRHSQSRLFRYTDIITLACPRQRQFVCRKAQK